MSRQHTRLRNPQTNSIPSFATAARSTRPSNFTTISLVGLYLRWTTTQTKARPPRARWAWRVPTTASQYRRGRRRGSATCLAKSLTGSSPLSTTRATCCSCVARRRSLTRQTPPQRRSHGAPSACIGSCVPARRSTSSRLPSRCATGPCTQRPSCTPSRADASRSCVPCLKPLRYVVPRALSFFSPFISFSFLCHCVFLFSSSFCVLLPLFRFFPVWARNSFFCSIEQD